MSLRLSPSWLLAGGLVSGTVALLVTAPGSRVYGLTPRLIRAGDSSEAAGSAPPSRSVGEVGGPTWEQIAVGGDPVSPRGVSEIRDELLALRSSGTGAPSEYRALLSELVRQGDAGMVATLELLGQVDFDMPLRGRIFKEVLEGVDDERIYPAVVELLETYRAAGWTYRSFREGYYEMVAQHGDEEGAEYLWELIRGDRRDDMARQALAEVREPVAVDRVLADLGTGDGFLEADLATALSTWNEPRVNLRLTELALDVGTPRPFRKAALQGLAVSSTDPAAAEALVASFRNADSPVDRAVALHAAYGLGENRHFGDDFKQRLVVPVLLEALRDPEPKVRRAAMSSIGDIAIYRTAAIESALVEIRRSGLEDSEQVELLLGKLRAMR